MECSRARIMARVYGAVQTRELSVESRPWSHVCRIPWSVRGHVTSARVQGQTQAFLALPFLFAPILRTVTRCLRTSALPPSEHLPYLVATFRTVGATRHATSSPVEYPTAVTS